MNLDIANMVMNIGQTSQGFDWGNFWTALFASFFGAFTAYKFNIWRENKKQEEEEKAKLLKLFYDINILIKAFVYYHENIAAKINNLTTDELKSITPITIKKLNIKIEEYGFITTFCPKLYEILTYLVQDINYIYEQEKISSEYFTKTKKEIYLIKLDHIKVSTKKLLAKLFVCLLNLNNALIKHYKLKNLIKDEVINSYIRAKKVLDKTKKAYTNILSTSEKLNIDKENLKTIKIDLDYINEILDTWVIDFGLNEKQKEIIEKEIADQAKLKWEAPENEI